MIPTIIFIIGITSGYNQKLVKTKKAFPIILSFLAIVSIASTAVLGNTQNAYAGIEVGCTIEPDMVDAGILAVGERFVAMKEIICLIEIVEVNIDDKSDCVDKGIEVRIGDFGIEPDELIWSGEEVIDNIAADIGKTTCTVIFEIEFKPGSGDQLLPQTIMVSPPIVPVCGDMYVVTGFHDNTDLDGGALALVDYPGTGDVTQIGLEIADQVGLDSLPGMAFDTNGRLFVIAQASGVDVILLEINPSTGVIVNNIGQVRDSFDNPVFRVRDLAMQNNVLWGVGEGDTFDESIFTINTNTAVVSMVSDTDQLNLNGLAIIDGTFFATERFADELYTVDPMTGDTTFVVNLDTNMDGLGSNSLGQLFGTKTGPDSVHLIDITDGSDDTVGAVGENPSDVDFFPCEKIEVGGELLPIDSTALLLAGTQTFSWMIPVVLSILGIGLFVVSRKSENS